MSSQGEVPFIYVILSLAMRHWIIAVLLVAAAVFVAARLQRRRAPHGGHFRPAGTRRSPWTARAAEAVVLLAAGGVVLALTATCTNTGGRMLILDSLSGEFARLNVMAFAFAAGALFLAILVGLFWKTTVAVVLAAAVLVGYAWCLNGWGPWTLKALAPESDRPPVYALRFALEDGIRGADVYVNGVNLGKSPLEIPLDEFYEKVPYWPDPPADMNVPAKQVLIPNPRFDGGYIAESTWFGIRVRNPGGPVDGRGRPDERPYYARVKLGDEWGGGSHWGRSGRGSGHRRLDTYRLPGLFPARKRCIEALLDKARLSDYTVGEEWFRAMETYRYEGPRALREAAVDESELMAVVDAWAVWRYGLSKATSAAAAWEVFERICREADERREYDTSGTAGRAVELLVGKLDPEQLVSQAESLLKRYRGRYPRRAWGERYGRMQFFTPPVWMDWASSGRAGDPPASTLAVAHAVWMLDQHLNAMDDTTPNIVELRIAPEIVRTHSNYELAAYLGGPEVERFFLRQDWRTSPEVLRSRWDSSRQVKNLPNGEVNRWFYILVNLDSPAGKLFRLRNRRAVLEFADEITRHGVRMPEGIDALGFLFLDLGRGEGNPAWQYWPEFRKKAEKNTYDSLGLQWDYLARMEPLSTVEMYLECWRGFSGDDHERAQALKKLEPLPQPKRQEILDALAVEIREMPDERGVKVSDYLARELRAHFSDERFAQTILAEFEADPSDERRDRVARWLERTQTDHPLINALAGSGDPRLAVLVMGALKAHPTAPNREMLNALLKSEDAEVRGRAQEVKAYIDGLAAESPSKFAAPEQSPG